MKTKINFIKAFVILTVASLFTIACSKPEDGAPGPAGPAGTANVIYSNWVTPSSYVASGPNYHYQTIFENSKDIYKASMNGGVILVYWNQPNNGNTVYQLNYRDTLYFFNYSISTNGVTSDIDISNNYPNYDGVGHTDRFRYIIIPGGTPATTGKQAQPDFKKMSYNEVCKYLHIPE